MFGRLVRAGLPAGVVGLALSGAAAASSADVDAAMGTLFTLIGVALLLWVVGNIITGHRYDARGPKGEKLPPAQ